MLQLALGIPGQIRNLRGRAMIGMGKKQRRRTHASVRQNGGRRLMMEALEERILR
jgi:hypothetical protein